MPGGSQNGCLAGRVSGMGPNKEYQDDKYDELSVHAQPERMSAWRESVLAADAK